MVSICHTHLSITSWSLCSAELTLCKQKESSSDIRSHQFLKELRFPLEPIFIGTLKRMWTLERCWNIKALSPTVYGWNDNGLLYYSKTMDKALQVWYHWTHLDFNGGIERMVFCVDLKTSEYPGREQLTSWRVGGLFPVHLSLLFPSKKALPSWVRSETAKVKPSGDPGAPHPAFSDRQSLLGSQDLKMGRVLFLKAQSCCADKMKYRDCKPLVNCTSLQWKSVVGNLGGKESFSSESQTLCQRI